MAHPFNHHREVHAGRSRAHEFVKGHKGGGPVHKDAAADRKLFGQLIKEHDAKVHGRASGGRLDRYARGGKTKHGSQVNIAIVTGKDKDHGNQPMAGGPPPMAPPPSLPPKPPMGGAPPMPPPGGMPPGGPLAGGPPMRPPMKRGGKVGMKAASLSGEGRLEKVKAYGAKARRGTDE